MNKNIRDWVILALIVGILLLQFFFFADKFLVWQFHLKQVLNPCQLAQETCGQANPEQAICISNCFVVKQGPGINVYNKSILNFS